MTDQLSATASTGSPCILCLDTTQPLTAEHIFPEAAGGTISRYLLCKPCNDKLGRFVDAHYLEQKHIQLARVVYKIQGKTGKIPQPFSDTYSVDGGESQTRIKLDENFAPRVVPEAPEVWVTKTGDIGFRLFRDVRDRKDIPKIIRTVLSRFFKSDDGKNLKWSEEKQESSIQKAIEEANKIEPKLQQIQSSLGANWTIDKTALFVEYVKVLYEVCCIEFGPNFIGVPSAERLRKFLLSICTEEPAEWDLEETAKRLNVSALPDPSDFVKRLTNSNPHTYHVAVAMPSGAACSMLGMGAVFGADDMVKSTSSDFGVKVYLSSVSGDRSGVFTLLELLAKSRGRTETPGPVAEA